MMLTPPTDAPTTLQPRLACKDIPDLPILQFLADHGIQGPGGWCNWCYGDANDVSHAMPQGIPDKLRLSKMARLIRRGLVDGCPCGCRGDFTLTPKGRALLNSLTHPRPVPEAKP